ncbi:hypothetical protein [Serratia marcescens]|uniref:hypothetical protein n=1 Tax=Serratia marcescens TaxID=615 RepID=UPI00138AE3D2|nr:hypothetical protein [Serratia marcescens]
MSNLILERATSPLFMMLCKMFNCCAIGLHTSPAIMLLRRVSARPPFDSTHDWISRQVAPLAGAQNNIHNMKHSINRMGLQMLQSCLIIHHRLLN